MVMLMPRLPRNVPVSKPADDGKIYAALTFACTTCWDSDSWGFIAYNYNGVISQIRRCFGEYCYMAKDGDECKGKWITQAEQSERTRYQIEGDEI
jgi:hypothetical protein